MNKFNCTLPWIVQQKIKLCPILDKNRKESYADIVTTWHDSYQLYEDKCPKMPKCKRSIYKMDISMTQRNDLFKFRKSHLEIELNNPNILTIIDDYSYDLQSFIGEVGGTLGLFLGMSMFSFIEFIEYVLRKLCSINIH